MDYADQLDMMDDDCDIQSFPLEDERMTNADHTKHGTGGLTMRLIDANALKDTLTPDCCYLVFSESDVIEMIDEAPTIDPNSLVKHGKWIEDEDGYGRHCSECGTDYCYLVSDAEKYNYCPMCGAKMTVADLFKVLENAPDDARGS